MRLSVQANINTPNYIFAVLKHIYTRVLQLIDVKAIQGDSSDNIPGVQGIGPKGAIDLISQFGSIENIYENL